MILLDSSAWIKLTGRATDVAARVENDEVALCPPVAQELLQGAGTLPRYAKLMKTLRVTIMIDDPLPLSRFEEAARIYLRCRAKAFTIRKSTDCLIAACAIAHGLPLLHDDRDFDFIAEVAPLNAQRV